MVCGYTKDKTLAFRKENRMHTLRLLLLTTVYDEQIIEKRYHAVSHIHNVLVKHAKMLLAKLNRDEAYQKLRNEYVTLFKKSKTSKRLSSFERKRMKELSTQMNDIRLKLGLSEYGFQAYIKVCASQYRKLLSSQQVQKEATRVWRGTEKVLFGDGREIRFKKFVKFDTICGKTNTNGVKFDKETMSIDWMGLSIICKVPKKFIDRQYMDLSLDNDISYCEIKRMMFNNGWHYYVIIYLKGDAPNRLAIGNGTMGIDPGVSTMAGVSDTAAVLKELAPKNKDYEKRIFHLQQYMDRSRRTMNPNKFRPDGTINKANHDPWVCSNGYLAARRKLKSLFRKKSAYTKQSHEELINELLSDSINFIVEDMNYMALAKRARETKRGDKISTVVSKDGTVKEVHKYKRKKRFGKSVGSRAPSMFLTLLKQKCQQYGGTYQTIDTQSFKASQYDHMKDEYIKVPLSQREKLIDGIYVQRDLYSAFLVKNADKSLKHADREKCLYEFKNFIELQTKLIISMKATNVTMTQCFGF